MSAARNPTVVLVDDEDIVLSSIRALLALETPYDIVTFTSPKKALEYIASTPVDLVVSDYLMPEMDGITFLGKVRELKPDIPRIILTGYADKENAIKAINEVGLYQYIEKPWENDELILILRNGLERRQLMERLEEKIRDVNKAHAELMKIQREILKVFA